MIPENKDRQIRRELLLENVASRLGRILRDAGPKPSSEAPGSAESRDAWRRAEIYLKLKSELSYSDDAPDEVLGRYAKEYPEEKFNL